MMARCRVICYIRKPDWTILLEALDDINKLSRSKQRNEDEYQRNVLKYVVVNCINYIVNVHNFLSIQTICVYWQWARASETFDRISGEFKFEKQSWKSHLLNSGSNRPDGKNWSLHILRKIGKLVFCVPVGGDFESTVIPLHPQIPISTTPLSWQRHM